MSLPRQRRWQRRLNPREQQIELANRRSTIARSRTALANAMRQIPYEILRRSNRRRKNRRFASRLNLPTNVNRYIGSYM